MRDSKMPIPHPIFLTVAFAVVGSSSLLAQAETPETPAEAEITQAWPMFPVKDVDASLKFYEEALGFSLEWQDEHSAGIIWEGANTSLILAQEDQPFISKGRGNAYLHTTGIEKIFTKFKENGGKHLTEPTMCSPTSTICEFSGMDPDGNRLQIGEDLGPPEKREDLDIHVNSVWPMLPVEDVEAAVAYFEDTLGYRIYWEAGDHFVSIGSGSGSTDTLIIQKDEPEIGEEPGNVYLMCQGVDEIFANFTDKGGKHLTEPTNLAPPGDSIREFSAVDLDGNRLLIGECSASSKTKKSE